MNLEITDYERLPKIGHSDSYRFTVIDHDSGKRKRKTFNLHPHIHSGERLENEKKYYLLKRTQEAMRDFLCEDFDNAWMKEWEVNKKAFEGQAKQAVMRFLS